MATGQRGGLGPDGSAEKSVAMHQLRKEIRRTAKNISYDIKRLDRIARARSEQRQPGSGQQRGGTTEQQGARKGPGQELGREKDMQRRDDKGQAELSPQPGERAGQKAGGEAPGTKPGAIPSGDRGDGGGGEEAPTGQNMWGGKSGGSQPGTVLYSDKQEDMDVPPGRVYELRIKGDTVESGEDRDVESAGTEMIERREVFKKHAPTVGVDRDATLSDEQAEDDAIANMHIPVEYESIIKNIYTDNE